MVSIYLHFKFLNKCLFVRCGAYYIEIYHSVKYFLDKLFDILDKFYKLLIFNWLFFYYLLIFLVLFDTSIILLGLMMGAS
ncbi:hypothetical protein D6D69_08900 [Moraxella catarrhalis]|nr:hypothetical protein [Moraxella catarrhalis]RKM20178.1 hypothetical protein D6D69_08900 [Moraxella catarrhalis]